MDYSFVSKVKSPDGQHKESPERGVNLFDSGKAQNAR